LTLVIDGCPPVLQPASGQFPPARDVSLPGEDVIRDLSSIAAELDALQQNIGASWDRLNSWKAQDADAGSAASAPAAAALDAREASLDARDAMIRGHMHDVTRYHDELCARERDLAAQLAAIQAQRDELTSADRAMELRAAELDKRGDELKRREHVLAQRWARLGGMSCPHCGKSLNTAPTTPTR
jgi:septal ring factor EnvC (AmiA/AmiB activator)